MTRSRNLETKETEFLGETRFLLTHVYLKTRFLKENGFLAKMREVSKCKK